MRNYVTADTCASLVPMSCGTSVLVKNTSVVCVGGSWIAPDADVAASDWAAIEARARDARALK